MGLEDSFNVDKNKMTDAQWEAWLKFQERRRNGILGLLFLSIVIAAITAIVVAVVT